MPQPLPLAALYLLFTAAVCLRAGEGVETPAAAAPAVGSAYAGMARETARVHRLVLSEAAVAGTDLQLVLFSRRGVVYGGYALAGTGPQVPFKLVTTPAGPHGLFKTDDGTEIDYPKSLFDRYGYHKADFKEIRSRWSSGQLIARRRDDPPALAIDATGGIAGTVDVVLVDPAKGSEQPLRIAIQATADADGRLTGSGESWIYAFNDLSYGAAAKRTAARLSGSAVKDAWEASPAMAFPTGADWPHVHGPSGGMADPVSGVRLVDDIAKARLAWVSEEIMAGSKGDRNKTEFGLGALTTNDMDGGGYASPIVVDGKVYLSYHLPDLDRLVAAKQWEQHILRIRGAPLGNAALGMWRQIVLCADARSGKTLWRTDWPFDARSLPDEKQAKGWSPAYCDGVLAVRAFGTLYGFDAEKGTQLWKVKSGGRGVYWSCEESVTSIGGVFVVGTDDEYATGLAAYDPRTGKELWRQGRVCGFNAIPQEIRLDGKTWIISASGASLRGRAGSPTPVLIAKLGANPDYMRLVLIDPATGRIAWEQRGIGHNVNSILVEGDIVCVMANPQAYASDEGKDAKSTEEEDREGKAETETKRAGADSNRPWVAGYRVASSGAVRLWEERSVAFDSGRNTPMVAGGCFVLDSRDTGFTALDATTGRIRGMAPHIHAVSGGDHNWTWCLSAGDQIVSSGLLRWSLDGLKHLPGQLRVQVASGYGCPIKPALVDGRLFLRTKHQLVCYDLRVVN
jgi:outer membrane protein assembly factor BamB